MEHAVDDLLYLGLGLALFAMTSWVVREHATPPVEASKVATPPPGGPR